MSLKSDAEEAISEVTKAVKDLIEENNKQHKALLDMYYLYKGVEGLDQNKILEEVYFLIKDNENRN